MSLDRRLHVALGDSTAVGTGARADQGYVALLHRRMAAAGPVELRNLARARARSACVLRDQIPLLPARADLVTVGVGANDVTHATDLDQLERTWDRIGEALEGRAPVVAVGNVPDLSLTPVADLVPRAWFEGRLDALNHLLARVCARHGLDLVDLHAATSAVRRAHRPGDEAARRALFCPDGFHPSAAGYAVLADAWWSAIEPRLAAGRRAAG